LIYISPGILSVSFGPDRLLHINFAVAKDHRCDVQASPDLGQWTTISSVVAQTNGWIEVIDTSWDGLLSRFYRLVLH
jgi:hypothetical protein